MELVYLWVEDYKNIHRQGFNFSPRFECEFKAEYAKDETAKEKLKDNCELVIKPKEHLENFFGENINVTAIVGENGSGKSGLLKSLMDVFSENHISSLDEDKYKKYIIIYKYKGAYFYLLKHINTDINLIDNIENKIQWITKNPNTRLLTWHSDMFTLMLQNELKPRQIFYNNQQIVIEQIQADKNKIKKLILTNLMQNPAFKNDSNKFFTPSKVKIKINWNNLFNMKEDSGKYEESIIEELKSKVTEAKTYFKENKNKDGFEKIFDICNLKQTKITNTAFTFSVYTGDYSFTKNNYSCLSKIELNQPIKDVHKTLIGQLNQFVNLVFNIKDINQNIIDFIFDLPDYIFQIDLEDEYKIFEDLSFGERQLLTQLHMILHYATQKKSIQYEGVDFFKDDNGDEHEVDIDYEQKIKSMLVLLDEFEIGLHPQWQKKAIFYIIDFLKNIKDIDFNLLFTSHSPFILSDLPKENVIFLEKDKETGYCKNISEDVNINTFGANIHTLLSHGFFMKDGLMGEFAKEKINKTIKIIKKEEKLTDEEIKHCKNIISIIGEPILQKTLEQQLNKKINSNETELEKLEREQKTIQEKIDKLKKNTNETN